MTDIQLRPDDRWASFSTREHPAGRLRHIVAKGKPTSACGTTALPAEMWRGNSTKPMCPECLAKRAGSTTGQPDPQVARRVRLAGGPPREAAASVVHQAPQPPRAPLDDPAWVAETARIADELGKRLGTALTTVSFCDPATKRVFLTLHDTMNALARLTTHLKEGT